MHTQFVGILVIAVLVGESFSETNTYHILMKNEKVKYTGAELASATAKQFNPNLHTCMAACKNYGEKCSTPTYSINNMNCNLDTTSMNGNRATQVVADAVSNSVFSQVNTSTGAINKAQPNSTLSHNDSLITLPDTAEFYSDSYDLPSSMNSQISSSSSASSWLISDNSLEETHAPTVVDNSVNYSGFPQTNVATMRTIDQTVNNSTLMPNKSISPLPEVSEYRSGSDVSPTPESSLLQLPSPASSTLTSDDGLAVIDISTTRTSNEATEISTTSHNNYISSLHDALNVFSDSHTSSTSASNPSQPSSSACAVLTAVNSLTAAQTLLCGSTIIGAGTLLSVNYPNAYVNNYKLSWTLQPSPSGGKINLQFQAFVTEKCYDYVRIYNRSGSQVYAFSGSLQPFSLILDGPVFVTFTTDASVVATGFSIAVSTIVVLGSTQVANSASNSVVPQSTSASTRMIAQTAANSTIIQNDSFSSSQYFSKVLSDSEASPASTSKLLQSLSCTSSRLTSVDALPGLLGSTHGENSTSNSVLPQSTSASTRAIGQTMTNSTSLENDPFSSLQNVSRVATESHVPPTSTKALMLPLSSAAPRMTSVDGIFGSTDGENSEGTSVFPQSTSESMPTQTVINSMSVKNDQFSSFKADSTIFTESQILQTSTSILLQPLSSTASQMTADSGLLGSTDGENSAITSVFRQSTSESKRTITQTSSNSTPLQSDQLSSFQADSTVLTESHIPETSTSTLLQLLSTTASEMTAVDVLVGSTDGENSASTYVFPQSTSESMPMITQTAKKSASLQNDPFSSVKDDSKVLTESQIPPTSTSAQLQPLSYTAPQVTTFDGIFGSTDGENSEGTSDFPQSTSESMPTIPQTAAYSISLQNDQFSSLKDDSKVVTETRIPPTSTGAQLQPLSYTAPQVTSDDVFAIVAVTPALVTTAFNATLITAGYGEVYASDDDGVVYQRNFTILSIDSTVFDWSSLGTIGTVKFLVSVQSATAACLVFSSSASYYLDVNRVWQKDTTLDNVRYLAVNPQTWGTYAILSDRSLIVWKRNCMSCPREWKVCDAGQWSIVTTGASGVWAISSTNILYYLNESRSSSPSCDSGWTKVQGSFKKVAAGDRIVLGIARDGAVYARLGLSPQNPSGTFWILLKMSVNVVDAAVSPTDLVWLVSNLGEVYTISDFASLLLKYA